MADETQVLTDKVLNIKFSLEKLNQQKTTLEAEVKELTATSVGLQRSNKEFQEANKTFEDKLKMINEEITAKKSELAQTEAVYKDEIAKKFAEVEARERVVDTREKKVRDQEQQIQREKTQIIEEKKNNTNIMTQAEQKEKQNAIREVELNQKESNTNIFQTILNQKEEQVAQEKAFNETYKKSVMEREQQMITKFNTIARREAELNQFKNAIDSDRANHENEKTKQSYILKVLQSVQERCITNVGKNPP